MLTKWLAIAGLSTIAIAAQSQVFYRGNPNIIVPSSSIPRKGMIHTNYLINRGPASSLPNGGFSHGPLVMFAGPAGFHPADIQAAYQMPNNGGTQAIAIIDAFDNPTALADFNTFSAQFGLPQEVSSDPTSTSNKVFQVVYAQGSQPAGDVGWAGEIALDIEWAHAMAPKAKIYLVEAADNGFSNLYGAEDVAKALLGVKQCSNSWGAGESGNELSLDSHFVQPGVTFFASAGDFGGAQEYPSESPNVVGVGGTALQMNGTTVTSETAWDGSGGGPSGFEPRPSFQSVVQSIVGTARGCPDIAAVADPNTGVAVFSTYAGGGWFVVGGTSVACPVCAGITNTRGQFKDSSALELARVYQNYHSKFYRDITSGTAGGFSAGPGWDFITGVGCPVGLYPVQVTVPTQPTSVSVLTGTHLSGNLQSLFNADGNTYDVASAATVGTASGVGPSSTIVVTFHLTQPSSALTSMLTTMNATGPSGSTIQLFAYNWGTKQYDVVQAFPGMGTVTANTATLNNLGKYENGGNIVQFAVRTFMPTRANAPAFTSHMDMMVGQAN